MSKNLDTVGRRVFVTGVGGATAVLGAGLGEARAQSAWATPARWQPVFEPQDDWMELPGRHRFVFDCTSATGAGDGLAFADTYFTANQTGYRLSSSDLAVLIILRHFATVFAYDDGIWAKYGARFGEMLKFNDPKTKAPPARNIYYADNTSGSKDNGATLSALTKKGVHFAVCGMATQKIAEFLAGADKGRTEGIRGELIAAMISNAHLAAAGIVALNRAQERGYAIAHMG